MFSIEGSLEWFCDKCSADTCKKCEIIFRRGKGITCKLCACKYHVSCAGLNQKSLNSLDIDEWFCYNCNNDIFPYNNIKVNQLEALSYNSLATDKQKSGARVVE